MSFNLFLIQNLQELVGPSSSSGWIIWLSLFALVLWLTWRGRPNFNEWKRQHWLLLIGLTILTPVLLWVLVIRLPVDGALPIPGLAIPAMGPILPILAATPWMLGGAVLGALPGAILAGFSGLLLALWDTRSLFTPLEFALLATLFAAALRQNYRTPFFALMRRPWIAAVFLALSYPFLFIINTVFWTGQSLVSSLDFAISRVLWVSLSVGAQLLAAALLVELLRPRISFAPSEITSSRPSPAERSLQGRFLATLGPIVVILFIAIGAVVWVVAGRAATQMMTERMRTSTQVAAAGIPFLLETGQDLILQMASDVRLTASAPYELSQLLEEQLSAVPYFEQLVLLESNGNTLAGFPVTDFEGLQPGQRERDAVSLAFGGVPLQFFTIPPLDSESDAAQLSFVAAVSSGPGVQAVILGRTRLSTNPFAQPVLENLQGLSDIGGLGLLLDGDGSIVYQPGGRSLLAPYNGRVAEEALFYEDISPDGARRLVVFQPVTGSDWAIVAQLPASLVQQLALDIALPLLASLLLLALLAFLLLRVSLRTVTASLQTLVEESQRIAAGDLEAPLDLKSADEVGRLGQALEKMRRMLKARLGEIQRLLSVSQGVASSLDVKSQIDPILEAALASGASVARLVFAEGGSPEFEDEELASFGRGKGSETFQAMDSQILDLTRTQGRILLTNPARARLKFDPDTIKPEALAAFALKHEGQHLGALWLLYNETQKFGGERISYLQTLANQATFAAANANQYLTASLNHKRMEAILFAMPDAVLLTDQYGRLLLANPSALNLLGKSGESILGVDVAEVIEQAELLQLFDTLPGEASSQEVSFGDGRVFIASLSVIDVDGVFLGRACVLRDITEFNQADTLRSEFLSTVSHELRDPLELTRGYLTMLDMVGELNEKQSAYTEKIVQSVDGMSRLVTSLLDLERIESVQGLQLERFSIPEAIAEIEEEIRPRATQKQLVLELQKGDKSPPLLEADRTLFQRAVYNLMDNAIRHSLRGKRIEMWLELSDDSLTFAVRDQGGGIAPMDLPHVFERLRRSPNDADTNRGGLGLIIVKSIIERHMGRVWAESELGVGSTFYCQLPLTQTSEKD